MKKLVFGAVLAVISTFASAEWEYKTTESDMGEKIHSASLISQETKSGKKGYFSSHWLGTRPDLYIAVSNDMGLCFDDCLMEFIIDGKKVNSVSQSQLSYAPIFRITDNSLIDKLLYAREVKFKITNVRNFKESDVYTFKTEEVFDVEKLKALHQ